MNFPKYIPTSIVQFAKIYLTAVAIYASFRLILFFTEIDRINDSVSKMDIILSFVMGLRFDIVISGYILIIPFIVVSLLSFFNYKHLIINKIVQIYILTMYLLTFFICAINIPYFNQFFSQFSITAFEWLDNPRFVFKMIIQEPRYWLSIIPFLVFSFVFYKILNRIFSNAPAYSHKPIFSKIIISVLFLGSIFLGIRGRIEKKSPIRVGTAYFSNNPFLNQLGLNPNFTLVRSYLNSQQKDNKIIALIDNNIALSNIQYYLKIKKTDKDFPILRKIDSDSTNATNHNVVVIIMESMSAAKMKRNGNKNNVTPFLDSISKQGYYFENTYTSGIHTFNGIFSTIFSLPAIFRQHPMKGNTISNYHGLFSTLKTNGYSTIYFTTHDGQFDNVEGFLKANDCETVISESDYPIDKVKTTLGVPDDYMFEFSIPILNKLNQKNKPFAAVFMTASDHGPYYIPEYFKPINKDIKNQIIEYADYSLKSFIASASKQKWFENTIFIFVAYHGAPLDGLYDMSLDYNHTPLIFYAPDIIKEPKIFSDMAGQIDVYPSIMGLLKLQYSNNTLGIDLFKESRPYIFFNADDKYGVIDNDWFLIVRDDNTKSLYHYRNKDTHNYASQNSDIVEKMNVYARSNLQTFQYIIQNNKQ